MKLAITNLMTLLALGFHISTVSACTKPQTDRNTIWSAIVENRESQVLTFCLAVQRERERSACVSEVDQLWCTFGKVAVASSIDDYQLALLALGIEMRYASDWSDESKALIGAALMRRAASLRPCIAHLQLREYLTRLGKLDDAGRQGLVREGALAGDPTAVLLEIAQMAHEAGRVQAGWILTTKRIFEAEVVTAASYTERSRFLQWLEGKPEGEGGRAVVDYPNLVPNCAVRWSYLLEYLDREPSD